MMMKIHLILRGEIKTTPYCDIYYIERERGMV
jgi:hypothetical protein